MRSRGLQCFVRKATMKATPAPPAQLIARAAMVGVALLVVLAAGAADAKTLGDHQPHHRVHHRRATAEDKSCDSVKTYFDKLNVTITPKMDISGPQCGGHCCNEATENELSLKSTSQFEKNLRHHTQGLRSTLESTAKTFKDHILELSHQSENKTLTVFMQVYRRMAPLARQPISELYQQIRNRINGNDDFEFDAIVKKFFQSIFPLAYHHSVHSNDDVGAAKAQVAIGDFHSDYKNCLLHNYDELQPFGTIPKSLASSLQQSLNAATVFLSALDQSADILAATERIDSKFLPPACRQQLLKMTYCSKCNGIGGNQHIKSCVGYCTNVMRGCLAQYLGVLDAPWSKVADSIEVLYQKTEQGVEDVIKLLDVKLSEAIMHAMKNGPELEKKLKKSCGTPTLLPSDKLPIEDDTMAALQRTSAPALLSGNKWATTPPNTEMLRFLVEISKSKDFYSKIVDRICEEDDYDRSDRTCWTGQRVGDYTQTVMPNGPQRYNPEVPHELQMYPKEKLSELVDRLIKLRHTIDIFPKSTITDNSDIQSDMGDMRHYEEGSGGGYRDDIDDDNYDMTGPSGDGSGDGIITSESPELENRGNESVTSAPSSTARISAHLVPSAFSACALLVATFMLHHA